MADWQPIETAPRDGTRILVATAKRAVREVSWWESWYNDSNHPGWMIANCDEEYGCYISDATHWMPMPEPPTA